MGRRRLLFPVAAIVLAAGLLGAPNTQPAAAQDDAQIGDTAEFRRTYIATRLSFGGAREQVTTGREVEISIAADVLFAFDSADLSDDAQAILARTADDLAADATGTVTIVGHTDDVGTREYNQDLSERRASAVRDALAANHGVSGLAFQVEGRAFDEPAAEGTSDDARAANRRVEIRYTRG